MARRALNVVVFSRLAFPLCEPDMNASEWDTDRSRRGAVTSLRGAKGDRWWVLLDSLMASVELSLRYERARRRGRVRLLDLSR